MYSKHLMADSIKDDINAHMPSVDNDFLLLFYNLKVTCLRVSLCERFEVL